jgi:cardiolipin synthase A/B
MTNGFTAGITLHGFVVVLALLAYVVAAHSFNQRRHPTAAIAWVFFIMLVPYVALPSFLVFGSRKEARPQLLPAAEPPPATAPWAVRTIAALGQPAPATYAGLAIHADGAVARDALLALLDAARETIDICTFIVGRDAIGAAVLERLEAKARAGVRVRLMVDGMGRLMRSAPDFSPLIAAGARFVTFVPPLKLPIRSRSNLRDHRKLVLVDSALPTRRMWTGGRNLASEYFEGDRKTAAWHDLTFDVGGDLVEQAAELFERDWAHGGGDAVAHVPHAPRVHATIRDLQAQCCAQLVASGPDEVDDTIQTVLVTGAYQATSRIVLVTPYFVPDSALLAGLCMAARRGVTVELLVPAKSNHPMSDIARRRATRALAQAGGRVWLAPHMLHAKLALFDDTLALSGSANVDARSLFLNYELMVAFHDRVDVARFADWYARERAVATAYVPHRPGLLADLGEGLVLWTGFQL